ncbi:hypothetical protein AHiyo8_18610 [Arthrobacter sp. Hiyo8]|nr:hypothetical protein AHiyo8_18610 [Arthrobacter sp. Hiyo8]
MEILHDGGSGGELLRWVEPSELDDPTPYLPDGEFLLTAGLPFLGDGGSSENVDAYVKRLVGPRWRRWASGSGRISTPSRPSC